VAKRQADDGIVRLSELLAEQEQEKAQNGDEPAGDVAEQESDADEDPKPQLEEALNVLADLVLLNS
jgi:hypothetical protein